MADKITNFSDYKKKEVKKDLSETTEINNIEIEDPYNFFNAEEREQYFRERQQAETAKEEAGSDKKDSEPADTRRENRQKDYDEEEYDEEDYEDDEDEENSSHGISPELLVRIASVITGIFILVMLAFVAKAKIFDRFFFSDPDSQETSIAAIPDGYEEKNDTVVVTAESLNLRTVPSTDSDTYIAVKVPRGTQLKRIALSDDGTWALVEYDGQKLYGYMKYLSAS